MKLNGKEIIQATDENMKTLHITVADIAEYVKSKSEPKKKSGKK